MKLLKTKWAAALAAARGPASYRWALLLSLLFTAGTFRGVWYNFRYRYGLRPSWVSDDLDTSLIHHGLLQTPHFVDTLRWWVGAWVGEVPFYRPLTSFVFWLEWRLFGDREGLYILPTFAAHALATVLAAALAYRLAERWKIPWPALAAILTSAGFTGLLRDYRLDIAVSVAGLWKNQPDAFAASCCFLSLAAYLRAQTTDTWRVGQAAAWYLAACCFKEIAIPLPAICVALELLGPREGGWRRPVARTVTVAGCGLLFLAVRQWALGGTGYVYGSNDSWWQRSLLELLGPFSAAVPNGNWAGCTVALYLCIVSVWWWRLQPRKSRSVIWFASAAFLLTVTGWVVLNLFFYRLENAEHWSAENWGTRLGIALLMGQDPTYASSAISTLFVFAATAALWKPLGGKVWFFPWWTLVFLAPLALSPGPIHRYYLPQMGYILFDAMGCCALWPIVAPRLRYCWGRLWRGETSGNSAASAIQ